MICYMKLFISVEAQNCFTSGLSEILREISEAVRIINDEPLYTESNYGKEFVDISIIPSCMNECFWTSLGWKERAKINRKRKTADIRIKMDYNRFIKETRSNKRLLFIDAIVKSIRIVQEKSKYDFDGETLINDFLRLLNVSFEELNNL